VGKRDWRVLLHFLDMAERGEVDVGRPLADAELAGGLEVQGRTKTLFSTLKKLLRLGNTAAGGRARAQLYDIMGLRAIVAPRSDLPPVRVCGGGRGLQASSSSPASLLSCLVACPFDVQQNLHGALPACCHCWRRLDGAITRMLRRRSAQY
jgi:hypothetical protein